MKKLLRMRVLWFVLITCSLACGNSHAQSLNERLLKAIDAGKYDEAKKLILRGASPNYIQEIYVKGEKPKSLLQDFMTIKSKTGKKALAEVTGKLVVLPFVAIISAFTSRNKKPSSFYIHSTPLDHALYQADTPQRTQFVTWLFKQGARQMYRKEYDELFKCAILSQDLSFIDALLKQGYDTDVEINKKPCLEYVKANYPPQARAQVTKWLLEANNQDFSRMNITSVKLALMKVTRAYHIDILSKLLKQAQPHIKKHPEYFAEVFTTTIDINKLKLLVASGIKWQKVGILHHLLSYPARQVEEAVEFFLKKGADPNAPSSVPYGHKASPLSVLLYQKSEYASRTSSLVDLLIEHGANPLLQYDPVIPSALSITMINNQDSMFDSLIEKLTPQQIRNDTVPHVFIARKYPENKYFTTPFFEILMKQGFKWKGKKWILQYLLDFKEESFNSLKYFLKKGADPNFIGKYSILDKKTGKVEQKLLTPLNLLLEKYYPLPSNNFKDSFRKRLNLLINYGATPLLDTGNGSVMDRVIKAKDWDLYKVILEQLTPQHMETGNTQPLITACCYFDKRMVQKLFEKKIKTSFDKDGTLQFIKEANKWLTPQLAKDLALKHLLVYDEDRQRGKDKWRVLKQLLKQGANPNFSTAQKRPALNYLIEGHPQMEQSRRQARSFRRYARLLLKHQAQPLPHANDAKSALYLAVEKNLPTAVKMFLPQVPDSLAKQDTTLVAFALEHKASYSTVKRLLEKGFTQSKQYSPLALLIKQRPNQLGLVRLLIKYGADLKQTPRGHDAIAEAKYWMKQKPAQQAAYQKLIRLLEKAWKRQYKQPYGGKE